MAKHTLSIHDLAPLGDGIHRAGRERVYVDRTLPGDVVEAQIQKSSGGIVRADVVRIVESSPHRVKAPCPHYDICGGCTLQHASEEFYRAWKVETVRTAFSRQNIEPAAWLNPVFLPEGKRRRATFAASKKKNNVTLGYFRRRSHSVTDIAACLIADPAIMDMRRKLVSALAPILADGKPADIFVQTVGGQFDLAITGAVGAKGRPDLAIYEAAAELAHKLGIARISWRPKEYSEAETLVEITPFTARFGLLDVPLPPLAFLQPTKAGEDALTAAVMAALPDRGSFADLYSGCGTFSGAMLARGPVDAFDSVEPAVRALDKAKGPHPLRAQRRDLGRQPLDDDETKRYDGVVFDPPRVGAEEQARALATSKVPRVIGVSCNPVSFARDARIFVEGGYRLDSVQVVDQFAWSHHVELVAAFSR
ncbi:MAG: class I SAM-dependent RNA methyltransferase [Rhodospirillaceae bacterium]